VRKACCGGRFRGHGRRPSGQGEGGREADNAQIEDGGWEEKPPGMRAFLALREGRRGIEQVGGKRQAGLCSLRAAAATCFRRFRGVLRGRGERSA
jgi:hypothetical protein